MEYTKSRDKFDKCTHIWKFQIDSGRSNGPTSGNSLFICNDCGNEITLLEKCALDEKIAQEKSLKIQEKHTFIGMIANIISTGLLVVAIATLYYESTLEKVPSQKNEPSLEKVSFEKKNECAELRDQIEARIQKDWPHENESDGRATLEKIFYSPKRDSCLYSFKVNEYSKNPTISYEQYDLVDAFTNEYLTGEKGCIPASNCPQSISEAHSKFSAELKQYE